MRKLLSTLLLTASLPAFANIADDVKNDVPAADIAKSAAVSCGADGACVERSLKEMLEAGLTLDVVATAAILAGISAEAFTNAAQQAGLDGGSALIAFQKADAVINPTAGGKGNGKAAPIKPTSTTGGTSSGTGISPTRP